MAQFIFKLEGVLEQRLHAERQCQRDLAAAQRDQMRLRAALIEANEMMSQERLDPRGPVRAALLLAHARYADAMRNKIAGIEAKLALTEQSVAAAQSALVEAAKQRKMLEKLKEKQQAAWNEEQYRREMRLADEVSAQVAAGERDASES